MDFLTVQDLNQTQLNKLLEVAQDLKDSPEEYGHKLKDKNFVLIFQKPSIRTRVSFEVGVKQLGGNTIYLGDKDIGLGEREPVRDVARVLSRYVDCIIARTYSQEVLYKLRKFSKVPVINALSDLEHPCQALGDMFTLYERRKDLSSLKFTYIGDGNNVLNSLLLISAMLGVNITAATPEGYEPLEKIVEKAQEIAIESKSKVVLVNDPQKAVKEADVIYTDVWTSMGQEEEREKRRIDFKKFQVNKKLVALAKEDCLLMHCLPAHRGEEITENMIESENSIVFDQAENRLYAQKAVLLWTFGEL